MKNRNKYLFRTGISTLSGLMVIIALGAFLNTKHPQIFHRQQWNKAEAVRGLSEDHIPELEDIIVDGESCTALCEDGTVWTWPKDKKMQDAQQLSGLKHIVKIAKVDADYRTFYALSEEGYLYGWGENCCMINPEEDWEQLYENPVKIEGLSELVDMDVKDGNAFAMDQNGNFYAWGWALSESTMFNNQRKFPEDKSEWLEEVDALFAGAGNFSYFVRKDGTIFSIMYYRENESEIIFPQFSDIRKQFSPADSIYDRSTWPGYLVDLDETGKYNSILLHELGSCEDTRLIGADAYTVFLYSGGHTLRYWDSNKIKYHNYSQAFSVDRDTRIDSKAEWKEIDLSKILGLEADETPEIVDLCAGKENVLFLMEDGQVLISEYVTNGEEESQLQNNEYLQLKTVRLKKMDWKNIVRINTDGGHYFSAVDDTGDFVYRDFTPHFPEMLRSEPGETVQGLVEYAAVMGKEALYNLCISKPVNIRDLAPERYGRMSEYLEELEDAPSEYLENWGVSLVTADLNEDGKDDLIEYRPAIGSIHYEKDKNRNGSLIIYLSDGDDFDFVSVPYLGFLSDGPDRTLYVLIYKGKYYLLLEAIRSKVYQNVLKYPNFEEHSLFYICDYLYELDDGQLGDSSILVYEYETDLEHLVDMSVSVHESFCCIGNTRDTNSYFIYRKWTDEGVLIHLGGMNEEDKQERLNQKLKEAVYRILSQLREEGKNVCQYADDYVLVSEEGQIVIAYVLYTEEKGKISSHTWYFTVELEEEVVYVCAEGK